MFIFALKHQLNEPIVFATNNETKFHLLKFFFDMGVHMLR